MFIIKNNKTIIDFDEKVIFYSFDDFKNEIVDSENCFICGKSQDETEFNDEHIIPNWILREFNLHSEFITLPNSAKIKYGEYKIPCCVLCNSLLSDYYEVPISKLLKQDYKNLSRDLVDNPNLVQLIYKWINLIFLKTHLKDNSYRLELNKSIKSGSIGSILCWSDMHQIHCMARSFYTNAVIDPKCFGTIGIFEVQSESENEDFNYIDSAEGKGVLLQLGKICIIAVLNDACAVLSLMQDSFSRIGSPLNPHQCKEILANFNYLNLSLAEPPIFSSTIKADMKYHIQVKKPSIVDLIPENERLSKIGSFMKIYFSEYFKNHPNKEILLKDFAEEKRSFLWKENGEFQKNS